MSFILSSTQVDMGMGKFDVIMGQEVGKSVRCWAHLDVAWMGGPRTGVVQDASHMFGSGPNMETWQKEETLCF